MRSNMSSQIHFFWYTICFEICITYCHNVIYAHEDDWNIPSGFSIGCATSAYQIEGAWNISDKGESVWDRYTHTKSDKIVDKSNGDIACDSYNKFKEDVRLLKQLGVNHYRFSLSWPRILPTGYANVVNKEGIKYYNDLLDELKNNNITPFVTLYHWDHPQVFQEIGGWTNEAIVDLFGNYARVVFKELGHRIKVFATINEPSEVCKEGYYTGNYAPGLKIGKYAEYLCTHNIIKAHARAYHIYNDEFKAHQKGKIGIILNCDNAYSKNKNDNVSDEVAFQYKCGRYGSPIFSETGDYPDIIKKRIAENSRYEGLERSRLPTFSEEWINYIRGTADYYGLNHYHTYLVEQAPKPNNTIYVNDDGLTYGFDPNWPSTPIETIKIVPDGLRDLLRKIKKEYGNPPVYIMENGLADLGTLEDDQRIQYLYLYMKAVLTAIKYYNCNIKAYTIWSLIDNFEWERGYSIKYGIFSVNFNDPNRTRSPKKSVSWLSTVLHTSKLQLNF